MDWTALWLSLQLAGWTVVILLPVSILMGRVLAYRKFAGKGLVEALVMLPLVFSFEGLVLASVIFNLPFAIQPAQRGFESVPVEVREAAACCGMSPSRSLWTVELPLAWPGLLTAMVLTFAHTLGEFGIVLMVGGSIPGETKTIAIAIYDRVQGFDDSGAAIMSAVLVAISVVTITLTYWLSARVGRRLG